MFRVRSIDPRPSSFLVFGIRTFQPIQLSVISPKARLQVWDLSVPCEWKEALSIFKIAITWLTCRWDRSSNSSHCSALHLMFLFFGNVTNIPTVLHPSSTCQWFRLLKVYCQRLDHASAKRIFACEANLYFFCSCCACSLSLSFFLPGSRPHFWRLAALPPDDRDH